LDVNKDKVVWLRVVVLKWKMSNSRKSSAIWEYFSVDPTNVSVAVCKLCYCATSIQISGSGQIVRLISGSGRILKIAVRYIPNKKYLTTVTYLL